jgi:hypothetical protein
VRRSRQASILPSYSPSLVSWMIEAIAHLSQFTNVPFAMLDSH